MKKLSDKQLLEMYDNPSIKVDVSTSLGYAIMQAVNKRIAQSVSNKPNYDHKQGIN